MHTSTEIARTDSPNDLIAPYSFSTEVDSARLVVQASASTRG